MSYTRRQYNIPITFLTSVVLILNFKNMKKKTAFWTGHHCIFFMLSIGFPENKHEVAGLAMLLWHILRDDCAMTCRNGNAARRFYSLVVLCEVLQDNPQRNTTHALTNIYIHCVVGLQTKLQLPYWLNAWLRARYNESVKGLLALAKYICHWNRSSLVWESFRVCSLPNHHLYQCLFTSNEAIHVCIL